MKLIAGLGNKGKEYENTRHNIGFYFLGEFMKSSGVKKTEKNRLAEYAQTRISGGPVLLIKPMTYMNLSGEAVVFFALKHKIQPSDILVIHDDIDLPEYALKIKKGGGDGGHNGIKSITACLNTPDFGRLRVGVGRPEERKGAADYVLEPMASAESEKYAEKLKPAEEFIYNFINMGFEKAAGRFKAE